LEDLKGTRYLTIIVRLLLDSRGTLLQGELADVDGSTQVRFVGQDGLFEAIRSYVTGGADPPTGLAERQP